MENKRIFISGILLICSVLFGYSLDVDKINGIWVDSWFYDYQVTHQTRYKGIANNVLRINLDTAGVGEVWDRNPYDIIETIIENGTQYRFVYSKGNNYVGEMLITMLEDDMMVIRKAIGTGQIYEQWYRISGSAKKETINAVINDNRVRLRVKPNLKSDVWGYLNTGDKVVIIDKSEEKQEINDMNEYWYKVKPESTPEGGYPEGWIYGAYVDVE